MNVVRSFLYRIVSDLLPLSFAVDRNIKNETRTTSSPSAHDFTNVVSKFLMTKHTSNEEEMDGPSESGISLMTHCRQLEDWDCGVACILMALRWNKTEKRSKKCVNNWFAVSSQKSKYGMSQNLSQEEFCVRKEILKLLGTKSIWSIDLLIALYKLTNANHDISRPMTFPLSLLFCSANLGVDENYSNFTYYETSFAKDKFRVDKRFQLAKTLEIPMYLISNKIKGEPSAILLQHVINLLNRKDCIAIALIDNNILLRLQNAKEDNSDIIRPEDQPLETTCPYSGHYIILLGISTDISDIEIAIKNENGNIDDDEGYYFNECSPSSCIVITNPGSRKAVDYLTATHFESAWKSEGTDQDIIFLRQNGNNQLI